MKVWKFWKGYVNIGIMGKYPEKLINRCAESGIDLMNLLRTKDGVRADVGMDDLKKLRSLARGCALRVRINSKHGFPMFTKGVRHNAVFVSALAIMLVTLAVLSTRLWFISVETAGVPEVDIISALSDMGIVVGTARKDINCSDIANALDLDPRITNARVLLKGVTLTVVLSETGGSAVGLPEDAPANVYADKDCVITYLSVISGDAAVSAGQAVKTGDLLIMGDLSSKKEGLRVRADGVIYGEVLYRIRADAGNVIEKKLRTGEKEVVVLPELFGKTLCLGFPFESFELEARRNGILSSSPLPVSMIEYDCYELETRMVFDTLEGTVLRAKLMAQEKLKGIVPEDAIIKSVRTNCVENADGSVTAIMTVTAVERIGVHRGI